MFIYEKEQETIADEANTRDEGERDTGEEVLQQVKGFIADVGRLKPTTFDCDCEVAISPAAGVSGSKTFGGPEYLHWDVDQVSRERPED